MKKYKIIDFHTHPFMGQENNICLHTQYCNMSMENTQKELSALGIEKICGSVICRILDKVPDFSIVKELNDKALELREKFNGYYIPGFHIHPHFKAQSIAEIERMSKLGVNLIGELCPYILCWSDYTDKNLWDILEVVEHYKMVVNFHGLGSGEEQLSQMDEMVKRFKNIIFVGAHPSEGINFAHHAKRLAECENYYVDLSGGGLSRHGTLRHLITEFGKERILFGSDYPICNPAMHVGGVALDGLISEQEKEYVFHKNAERILRLD